ncbi:MAG: hypothetical protein LBT40_16020 [Deltaproteobacteria bacterium]|nr:hypothetical protein [Deltaproteobacteria bacterium]
MPTGTERKVKGGAKCFATGLESGGGGTGMDGQHRSWAARIATREGAKGSGRTGTSVLGRGDPRPGRGRVGRGGRLSVAGETGRA